MKRNLAYKLLLFPALIFILLLNGCLVGPKYSRPETAADVNDGFVYTGQHNEDVNDLTSVDRWWEQFGDPVTADLVREALEKNYNLQAAAARVLQAHALLSQTSGVRLPNVSYNLNRDRSKVSFNLGALAGGRFSFMNTTWTQNISVAYALDLFGKLKHNERAAWANMLASQANEVALTNTTIASVVIARINIATLEGGLAIARSNTESLQKTLNIVERRYEQGLVGPVDIRLARENLASSKAAEPALEMSLIQARNALDVLLARRPGSSEELPDTLRGLPDLEPLPIGIPVSLLNRRPDVMAAELSLQAANELIGVNIAQLFPDLNIVASYGASADRWRDIWEHFSETYSLTTSLAQPIFRGGQILAQIDEAKALYAELAANYAQTVLIAIREVEDALVAEQLLQEQYQHTQRRFEEAKAAEDLSRQRYEQGIEGILTVLESERRRRAAEDALAVLRGQIWTARVNLHLAIGGNWNQQEQETVVVEEDDKK